MSDNKNVNGKGSGLMAEGMAYLAAFKAEFQTLEMLMDMKSTKKL
jgi:hypothetical protein